MGRWACWEGFFAPLAMGLGPSHEWRRGGFHALLEWAVVFWDINQSQGEEARLVLGHVSLGRRGADLGLVALPTGIMVDTYFFYFFHFWSRGLCASVAIRILSFDSESNQ